MATVQLIINLVNNASRGMADVTRSAMGLAAAQKAAEAATKDLNTQLAATTAPSAAATTAQNRLARATAEAAVTAKAAADAQAAYAAKSSALASLALQAASGSATAAAAYANLSRQVDRLGQANTALAAKAELAKVALQAQAEQAAKTAAEMQAAYAAEDVFMKPFLVNSPWPGSRSGWGPQMGPAEQPGPEGLSFINGLAAARQGGSEQSTASTLSNIVSWLNRVTQASNNTNRSTGLLGATAAIVTGRWWGLGRAFGGTVDLMAGAGFLGIWKTVGALHLLLDVGAEIAAVVIPALIGVGVYAALAGPILQDMYKHLQNVYTVVTATGKNIAPFSGGLSKLQNALKPSIMVLWGDALEVATKKTGELGTLSQGVGQVLDNLGNRVAAALTSGGMDVFMRNAVMDVKQLGDVVGNFFGIIGNLLHAMPGYATILLGILDHVTSVAEHITSSGIVQGATKVGLAFHGAALYIGLFGTLAGRVLERSVGALGAGLTKVAPLISRVSGSLATSVAEKGALLTTASAGVPWAWVAVGVTALGFLIYKLATAQSATERFVSTVLTKVGNAKAGQGLLAISEGIQAIHAQMDALGKAPTLKVTGDAISNRFAGEEQQVAAQQFKGNQQALLNGLTKLQNQAVEYNNRVNQLTGSFGSLKVAQFAVGASGLTLNQFLSRNANQMAQNKIAIDGVIAAYKTMGQPSGALGADVIVMGRLNGVSSEQITAVQNLNQAWDSYIQTVQGSQSAFDNYAQGLTALNKAQTTATDRLGKYSAAIKLGHATIDGTTQADIALNQAFTDQVGNAQQLIDAWRMAGVEGNTLSGGVKNLIAPLTKFAKGSGEATGQLIALASEAGYNGPNSLKALLGWLGLTTNSLAKVKQVSDQATIQESLLTSALNGQGAVIANQLIGQLNETILKTDGVYNATTAYAQAVAKFGSSSEQAKQARQQLIDDIVRSGVAAHDTTAQIAELISKILHIPLHRAITLTVDAYGQFTVERGGTGGRHGRAFFSSITGPGAGGNGLPVGRGSALGWYVRGGIAGKDSVPVMAMPGEVIVPTSMVNQGAVSHLRGKIPGYATGGMVGNAPLALGDWTQSQYQGTVSALATATARAAVAALQASSAGGGFGASGGGPNAALARRMMPAWGNGPLWQAWNYIGMKESGWNAYAVNPSSGAAGIAQRIQGWGPGYQPGNAAQQIAWMISYIQARYGNPIAAARHERAMNWYGTGGMINEPIFGVGLNSGQGYGFGEKGKEFVSSGEDVAEVLQDVRALLEDIRDLATSNPEDTAAALATIGSTGRGRNPVYGSMYNTRG